MIADDDAVIAPAMIACCPGDDRAPVVAWRQGRAGSREAVALIVDDDGEVRAVIADYGEVRAMIADDGEVRAVIADDGGEVGA